MHAYSLISSIFSYFYISTPWSLYLFRRVPSQLHWEHTVLQLFRRIEIIIHTAVSVIPGTYFYPSQGKHLRVKCLAQRPILRGVIHAISMKILHQAGLETARQAATLTKLRALTIVPCPSQNECLVLDVLQSNYKQNWSRLYCYLISFNFFSMICKKYSILRLKCF